MQRTISSFVSSRCALIFLLIPSNSLASHREVTNGILNQPEELAAIVNMSFDGAFRCTATFVSPTTALTASHCGFGLAGDVFYNGIKAVKNFQAPQFTSNKSVSYDVRVIVFDTPVAPAWLPVARVRPAVGTNAVVAGYGCHEMYPIKCDSKFRWGQNTLKSVTDSGRQLNLWGETGTVVGKEGENVSTGAGDSGSPLIVNGEITGTLFGGALSGDKKYAVYSSLHSKEITDFLCWTETQGAVISRSE